MRDDVDALGGDGLQVGVINARFVRPLDVRTILHAVQEYPWAVTAEEGSLAGGFGSAVLEVCCDAGVDASRVRRLGVPDRYIEHGSRQELLSDLGLDRHGIAVACRVQHNSAAIDRAEVGRGTETGARPRPSATPTRLIG